MGLLVFFGPILLANLLTAIHIYEEESLASDRFHGHQLEDKNWRGFHGVSPC